MENSINTQNFKNQIQKRNLYTKHDAGIVFLLCLIAPQVLGLIFVVAISSASALFGSSYSQAIQNPIVLTILTALSQLCFVAVFFCYNKFAKINYKNACKINYQINALALLIAIVIGLVALFGFNNLITCFDAFLQSLGHTSSSMPLPLDSIGWLLINILVLCALPAVFEELLFRGIILNGLKQYGRIAAIVISAALFALMHGNIDQLIYPFILGIVFGFIADYTNSVIPTIAVHFINNFVVIIINYIYEVYGVASEVVVDGNFVLTSFIFALSAAIGIFGLLTILKRIKPSSNKDIRIDENELSYVFAAKTKTNKYLWIAIGVGLVIWFLGLLV